jgi:hypothetical protein
VGAALFAMLVVTFVSEPFQLFLRQILDRLRGLF